MDQIEIKIKLQKNDIKIFYLLIGRSDKIEKLKEVCKILSDIPPDQQILIYKGKILSNDKLISDYNINDRHNIILKKKEEPSPAKAPLEQNSGSSNLKIKNNIISKDDFLSFLKEMYNNNLSQLLGYGNFSDIYKQILNEPNFKDIMNNILNDPSLLEIAFNNQ